MMCASITTAKQIIIKQLVLLFSLLCVSIGNGQQSIFEIDAKADSLYYYQSNYYSDEEYKAEIALRDKVLDAYNDVNSQDYKSALAKKYATEASYAVHNMEYDKAIDLSQKALKVYKDVQPQNLVFKGFVYKKIYFAYGAINKALIQEDYIKKAIETFKDTLGGNHLFLSDVEFDYGMSIGRLGDFDKVIEQYKKGVAISIDNLGENNTKSAIYEHHLAIVYGFLGYYQKELESYKKVIARWEAMPNEPDRSYLSIAYGSLATWYRMHGDLKTAEMYLAKKQHLVNSRASDVGLWFNETYKGRTQYELWKQLAKFSLLKKDTTSAWVYYNKIKTYFKDYDFDDPKNNPHNLPYSKVWAMDAKTNIKRIEAEFFVKNNPKKAIQLYEDLLKDRKKFNYDWSSYDVVEALQQLYVRLHQYDKASDVIQLGINEPKTKSFDIKYLKAAQANVLFLKGDYKGMRKAYKETFLEILKNENKEVSIDTINADLCKPYGDEAVVEFTIVGANNFYNTYLETKDTNDLHIAHNLSKLACDMFSDNFAHMIYNDTSYNSAAAINDILLKTSIALQVDTSETLERIENMSSRLSWKKFLHSQMSKNLNVPDSIRIKESDLKSELHFYRKKLFTSKDLSEDKIQVYKNKITAVETELEGLQHWYQEHYPTYASLALKPFDVNAFQYQLKANQKVIKYVVAKNNVYAFSITKDEVSLHEIGERGIITEHTSQLSKALNTINTSDYKTLAKVMYNELLPISIVDGGEEELIFIPDDVLHYIPMEALIDSNNNYLIKTYKVSYAASLLLFNEQIRVKRIQKNKMGVFAPVYKKKSQLRAKRNDSTQLLGANEEAKIIAKLFNATSFIGAEADKEAFIEKAGDFGVLHLAMHSSVNNEVPEFSNFSFSPNSKDNKLFISELYNIPLNANLAVLSACNTANGELKKGDGVLNMSRAFTYAGVPSTVASLWEVPDKETSEIMVSFYNYLKAGKTKNEALQLAKLDYLNTTSDSDLHHPYFWAGFTLNGDLSSVEIESQPKIWPYITLGVALLLLFLFYRKRLLHLF